MKTAIVSNRILNQRYHGALDKEQLRWPTEYRGLGLCRYLTKLRKERDDIPKGSETDRIMFQVIQSCYKYERFGVCPILSEPVAWFLEGEYLRGQEPAFREGMDMTLPDMESEELKELETGEPEPEGILFTAPQLQMT